MCLKSHMLLERAMASTCGVKSLPAQVSDLVREEPAIFTASSTAL